MVWNWRSASDADEERLYAVEAEAPEVE